MGCGDSGGQCLIRADLVSGHPITPHSSLAPSFTGVGGSSAPSLGFVVIPLFFPDRDALAGHSGAVVKVWIEFQVVKELDCNFLIGRDATRAYSIDFVESEGHISMGGIKIPIADVFPLTPQRLPPPAPTPTVRAANDVTIPPFGECLVDIRLPPGLPLRRFSESTRKISWSSPMNFTAASCGPCCTPPALPSASRISAAIRYTYKRAMSLARLKFSQPIPCLVSSVFLRPWPLPPWLRILSPTSTPTPAASTHWASPGIDPGRQSCRTSDGRLRRPHVQH